MNDNEYPFALWADVVPDWATRRAVARIGIRMPYAPTEGGIINLGGPLGFRVEQLQVPNVLQRPLNHFHCSLMVGIGREELLGFLHTIEDQLIDCTYY